MGKIIGAGDGMFTKRFSLSLKSVEEEAPSPNRYVTTTASASCLLESLLQLTAMCLIVQCRMSGGVRPIVVSRKKF